MTIEIRKEFGRKIPFTATFPSYFIIVDGKFKHEYESFALAKATKEDIEDYPEDWGHLI